MSLQVENWGQPLGGTDFLLSNEGRNGPNLRIENPFKTYYYVQMDTFEQYTVYVSKETSHQLQNNVNWAELRYRFINSNKPFLLLGLISLVGGFVYLMSSLFSSVDQKVLPLQILAWAAVSYGLLYLSMKNVEPFEEIKSGSHKIVLAEEIKATLAQLGIDISTLKICFAY